MSDWKPDYNKTCALYSITQYSTSVGDNSGEKHLELENIRCRLLQGTSNYSPNTLLNLSSSETLRVFVDIADVLINSEITIKPGWEVLIENIFYTVIDITDVGGAGEVLKITVMVRT